MSLPRLPVPLVPALLGLSLAACGDEASPADPTEDRLDAVDISGEVGNPPEIDW